MSAVPPKLCNGQKAAQLSAVRARGLRVCCAARLVLRWEGCAGVSYGAWWPMCLLCCLSCAQMGRLCRRARETGILSSAAQLLSNGPGCAEGGV